MLPSPHSNVLVASCRTRISPIRLSSTKMSSTTLAPSEARDSNEHRYQSPLASSGKSIKRKTPREVVLHHPAAPPPPEDWILYPDDVIITKHSSVRHDRSCKIKEPQSTGSHRPWIRPDQAKENTRDHSHVYQNVQRLKNIPSTPSTSPNSAAPALSSNRGDAKKQPKPKFLERLPTPDLSDIEEDCFWSCCGSSEGST